jgi:hypothetical protein
LLYIREDRDDVKLVTARADGTEIIAEKLEVAVAVAPLSIRTAT